MPAGELSGKPQTGEGREPPFDVPPNPVAERIGSAEDRAALVEAAREAAEANAAELARLGGTSRYRSPAFTFARRLRFHPLLRDCPGQEAAERADWALGEAFDQDKAEFPWESVIGHNDTEGSQVDPFMDFINAWDQIRDPDAGVAEKAFKKAKAEPKPADHFGPQFSGPRFANFRLFLALAEVLQEEQGDEPICLPVVKLGELLGVGPQQVSAYRKMAGAFLTEVESSRPGKATDFFFRPPE